MNMKHSRHRHDGFKIHPVAVGCALMLVSSFASAQQNLSNVTVTGIRASIESAINTKRDAVGVVEAIATEDLGKLPDTTIGDSISRLPGVAAQRNAEGRAQQLSIRGMPPDFSTTLLNGRELVNPNDSRGAEYDAYPTELLNGVLLYKSPDATLMGQGISGTVNMTTIRPLSIKGRRIQAGLGLQANSRGVTPTGSGNNQSFSLVDQFNDGTLGLALGVTRNSSTSYSRETSFWDSPAALTTGQMLPFPKNLALSNRRSEVTREGAMAVLEFKPNRDFTSVLDLYSSSTDRRSINSKIIFPDMNSGRLAAGGTVVGGVAMAGTITNRGTDHVIQSIGQDQQDSNFAIGWNTKWRMDAKTTLVADLSKSRSTRTELVLDSNATIAGASSALSFNFNGGQPTYSSSLDFANASGLTLGSAWGNGWLKKPSVRDELESVRLEMTRELGHPVFSEVTLGANISDRTKVLRMTEGSVNPTTTLVPKNGTVNVGFSSLNIPTWDSLAMVSGGTYRYTDMGDQWWAMNKNWSVDESVRTIYSKLGIDTNFMGKPLRGNLGVQFVSTEQQSTGASNETVATWGNGATCANGKASDGGNCYVRQVSGGYRTEKYSYTDVLPSLNLAMEVSTDQVARLGVGKMVARPTMRDLRANTLFECWSPASDPTSCSGNRSGSGGNTKLDPFRATTFDLAFEQYFGKRAYIGVAGFYRDLDTFIYNETVQKDLVNQALGTTVYPKINFTSPKNGQGGRISGVELTANAPLDLLSPALQGFGAYISHSNTSSAVNIPNAAGGSASKMEMPGLSKRVTNLSFYYEKDGFSARVGQRSRSDFVGEITSNEYERETRFVKGESVVDAQVGYEFRTGSLKGLSVMLQGNNLTNADFEVYSLNADGTRVPRGRTSFGRAFMLNANYKF